MSIFLRCVRFRNKASNIEVSDAALIELSRVLKNVSMHEWIVPVTEELERRLVKNFQYGCIDEAGRRLLTEDTVAKFGGLKIQIFAKEHPPPHFRVIYAGETANFTINDCTKMNGGLNKWERNIKEWHMQNKDLLIDVWNKTRPSDCPVGFYRE